MGPQLLYVLYFLGVSRRSADDSGLQHVVGAGNLERPEKSTVPFLVHIYAVTLNFTQRLGS